MIEENRDEIRELDDRQQSRDKISIWYGSRSNSTHGLKEVVANSTDEIINNFDFGTVIVELFDDNKTIRVTDTGRGIPIDGETNGKKNYDLLFRTLFAGTKYDENEKTTTGTNGVGTTVLNYTSELFQVESYYGGYKYSLKFENGGELTQELTKEKYPKELHGTSITFRLDPEIYPVVEYDPEEVKDIVKRYSISTPKVDITLKYKDYEEKFHYDSVEDYFSEIIGNTATAPLVNLSMTEYNEENEKNTMKVIFTTCPEPVQESYLNLTYLSEGGTLDEGIIKGIGTFASKFCRDNRLFPKGVTGFNKQDIENSISFICINLSTNVEFTNQTKLMTTKPLYRKIAAKHSQRMMEIFAVENPQGMKKLIDHLLAVQKHNEASQKAKQNLKRKLSEKVDGIGNKPENLVDCKSHGPESEIFIAEGNSALGSIILARDAKFQAAYPLRGKILNCLKTDYTTIFGNKVITDLIKTLGCGIQTDKKNKDLENFDIKKLRYGKIIIATDADSDGAQIACLIITMIFRLMPELLTQGYVYIAQTPLYEVKLENDQMIYYHSESEKDEKLPKVKGKYVISRVKGLGELDELTMSEAAMNPETRKLVQVSALDAKKMAKSLDNWMGSGLEYRKEYISENLSKYVSSID